MSEQRIKRAGCFNGDKENPDSLCEKSACQFSGDCVWKKNRADLPPTLGMDNNGTEARAKTG
jgi:hypothetical protein